MIWELQNALTEPVGTTAALHHHDQAQAAAST
jgi:hypothetical protein